MKIGLIACSVLEPELEHLIGDDPVFVHKEYLEFQLHDRPDHLRETLTEKVNALKGKVDAVLLGYSLCQSLSGFPETVDVPTAMFEGDDCICVFLGADEYAREKKICIGTWFSSPGWAREGLEGTFPELKEDLDGIDPVEYIDMLFEPYERCLYIDTGVKDEGGEYLAQSKEFAKQIKLRHEERKCDLTAFKDLIKRTKELAKSASS